MRVLGIAGSLRAGSHNRRLLELAAESFPDGVELAVWEELRAVPPYDADTDEGSSRLIASFRSAVAESDAVLIVTPEYNGSIPAPSRTRSIGPRAHATAPCSATSPSR